MAPQTRKPTSAAAKAAEQQADAEAERARVEAEQAEAEKQRVEAERQQAEDAAKGRAEVRREADTKEERAAASRVCVVSDGTPHMGRALPGKKICSAHEMHYLPDGTSRRKANAAAQKAAEEPGVTEQVG